MKANLLIIDDDEDIRTQLKWALNGEYEINLAEDPVTALEPFKKQQPAVVLLDLGLPPHPAEATEGMNLLKELLVCAPATKVIILTGQSEKHVALQAIGEGAYDFLSKPVQIEELRIVLKRAFYLASLEKDYREMERQVRPDTFEGMIGASRPMQELFMTIRKVAAADAPVLILGESGTGKEMAALAIHRRSRRKDGPFVAINCGAIPEALLESELFGHEKGSFTGAHAQRKGRIEAAAGGTLLLDEIGELPLSLQVKLLRFLQEQTIERVGGRSTIAIDTRVIAATNSDLNRTMKEGKFREDLYYRLACVVMKLPPLRDRDNDTLLLAQAFLRSFASQGGKERVRKFTPDAVRALSLYQWPGNIRELENRVKRAVIMAEGRKVTETDLELNDISGMVPRATLKEAREAVERQLIQLSLQRHRGSITEAAAELGVSRPTMYDLMGKLGIATNDTKPAAT